MNKLKKLPRHYICVYKLLMYMNRDRKLFADNIHE